MSSSVIQVLQMKQIPQIVVILMKMLKVLLSFTISIKGEESSRVNWPISMARSRLMMITSQPQRIYYHQSKEMVTTLIIHSLLDGDMLEYAVVIKLKVTIQKPNYSILVASLVPPLLHSFELMFPQEYKESNYKRDNQASVESIDIWRVSIIVWFIVFYGYYYIWRL